MKRDVILKEFKPEARQLLTALSNIIDSLTRLKGTARSEHINRAFLTIHSLKAASLSAGLKRMAVISHRLEDLFAALRLGHIQVDQTSITVLKEIVSTLQKVIDAASHQRQEQLLERAEETLEKMDKLSRSRLPDASLVENLPLDSDIRNALTEYDDHRLAENMRAGCSIYEIQTSVDLESFDRKLRTIREPLAREGEIISILPVLKEGPGREILLQLIYASRLQKTELDVLLSGPVVSLAGASVQLLASGSGAGQGPSPGSFDNSRSEIDAELALSEPDISGGERASAKSRSRMVSLRPIFDRASLAAEQLAGQLGKRVRVRFEGRGLIIERAIAERLSRALTHILRNAVDHGIEVPSERLARGKAPRGCIYIKAERRGEKISIVVEDDGAGIDPDLIKERAVGLGLSDNAGALGDDDCFKLLFKVGFSTRSEANLISGRGIGLSVVEKALKEIGGEISVRSQRGSGTCFEMIVPARLEKSQADMLKSAR